VQKRGIDATKTPARMALKLALGRDLNPFPAHFAFDDFFEGDVGHAQTGRIQQ